MVHLFNNYPDVIGDALVTSSGNERAEALTDGLLLFSSGLPAGMVQKVRDVCELSNETCSSLRQCVNLFSKQEGVGSI